MFDFRTIRQIRKIKDLTLTELEKKSGIAHSNISNIEFGKKKFASVDSVERILNSMGFRLIVAPIPEKNNCPCHFSTGGTTVTFKEEKI